MPLIWPAWTASRISVTVRPFSLEKSSDPQISVKCAADRVVGDGLVIGQEHRDKAGIRRALHVVLAAQRMQPGAGPADWPHISASEIRQRELSVPWMCWEMPMPQKIMPAFAVAKSRATWRSVSAGMPQIASIFSGGKLARCAFSASQFSV